jgi:hypothetical protein
MRRILEPTWSRVTGISPPADHLIVTPAYPLREILVRADKA